MFDAPSTMFFAADADHTDYLIAMGTNPRVSNLIRNHTALLKEMKHDEGRKLAVVDPRVSEFAKDVDVHLQETGTEVAVTSSRASLRACPLKSRRVSAQDSRWIPNGFGLTEVASDGTVAMVGVNINELTDANDRDPFTGCPHHKGVRCQVHAV